MENCGKRIHFDFRFIDIFDNSSCIAFLMFLAALLQTNAPNLKLTQYKGLAARRPWIGPQMQVRITYTRRWQERGENKHDKVKEKLVLVSRIIWPTDFMYYALNCSLILEILGFKICRKKTRQLPNLNSNKTMQITIVTQMINLSTLTCVTWYLHGVCMVFTCFKLVKSSLLSNDIV